MIGAGGSSLNGRDIGVFIRQMAWYAWRMPPDRLTEVSQVRDLPFEASIGGPQQARRVFTDDFDPYEHARNGSATLSVGRVQDAKVDFVRLRAETSIGPMAFVDSDSFVIFSAPQATTLAGTILRHDTEFEFHGPDADGWLTSAPDLQIRQMTDWYDRVDAVQEGQEMIYLIFKTFPGPRFYSPSPRWFA
jgi:hypothetical protein